MYRERPLRLTLATLRDYINRQPIRLYKSCRIHSSDVDYIQHNEKWVLDVIAGVAFENTSCASKLNKF